MSGKPTPGNSCDPPLEAWDLPTLLLCSAPCTERRREGPLDVHPTGHSQGCSLVGHLTNRCDRYGSPAHGTFVGNPKLMRCDFKICQTNIYNKSLCLGRFSLLKVKRDSSLQKVSNKSLPTPFLLVGTVYWVPEKVSGYIICTYIHIYNYIYIYTYYTYSIVMYYG